MGGNSTLILHERLVRKAIQVTNHLLVNSVHLPDGTILHAGCPLIRAVLTSELLQLSHEKAPLAQILSLVFQGEIRGEHTAKRWDLLRRCAQHPRAPPRAQSDSRQLIVERKVVSGAIWPLS